VEIPGARKLKNSLPRTKGYVPNDPNHLQAEAPHFGLLEYCKVLLPYGIPSLFMRLLNVFG
jgi:hypothetical protein